MLILLAIANRLLDVRFFAVTSVPGGLVAYHMTQLNPDEKITANRPGFRMVAGNPLKKARVYPDNVKSPTRIGDIYCYVKCKFCPEVSHHSKSKFSS